MRIKFKAPDPRAGFVAQMDSSRGQQLVDAGSAVQVSDEDAEVEIEQAEAVTTETTEAAPAKKATAKKK